MVFIMANGGIKGWTPAFKLMADILSSSVSGG